MAIYLCLWGKCSLDNVKLSTPCDRFESTGSFEYNFTRAAQMWLFEVSPAADNILCDWETSNDANPTIIVSHPTIFVNMLNGILGNLLTRPAKSKVYPSDAGSGTSILSPPTERAKKIEKPINETNRNEKWFGTLSRSSSVSSYFSAAFRSLSPLSVHTQQMSTFPSSASSERDSHHEGDINADAGVRCFVLLNLSTLTLL